MPRVIGAVVAGLVLVACNVTRPLDWSPDGSSVAVGFGGQVYLIAADGSGVTRVTTDNVISDGPGDPDVVWSPDGRTIAFTRGNGVWIVDVERSTARRIADGTHPAWSPDGRSIAYTVGGSLGSDSTAEVWIADAEGGHTPRRLARISASAGDGLDWAPDGQRLAACSSSGLIILGTDAGSPPVTAAAECHSSPDWSPDGRLAIAGETGLVVLGSDLRSLKTLTSSPSYVFSDRDPAWSPDGRRIAFTRTSGAAVVDVESGTVRSLGPSGAEHPAWAPDGRTMAVAASDGDSGAVYVIRDGNAATTLAMNPRLASRRAAPGSTNDLRLPAGAAAVGTELVLIARPLPAAVTLGSVALDAAGVPTVAFVVPDLPSGAYQLYLRGDVGAAWVAELLVIPQRRADLGLIAFALLIAAVVAAIAFAGRQRWCRPLIVGGAGLLAASVLSAVLAYPGLLLLGAGIGADRSPNVDRLHTTRGNVVAAIGAFVACGLVCYGLIAGSEPESSSTFSLDLGLGSSTLILATLGLLVMDLGIGWHAIYALRRRDGAPWIEAALLAVSVAVLGTIASGGAHAGWAIWPGLVVTFAAVTVLHQLADYLATPSRNRATT